MRQSEFWTLVDGEFGPGHGRLLVRDHVLMDLGGRTAGQALAEGESVRDVWLALARSLDVPESRWWGAEPRHRSEHRSRR